MTTAEKPKAGLEDTVATSSAICFLDGDRGVLAYCGYDIHDLARHATFEEVCYLLWHRRLPTRAELATCSRSSSPRASCRSRCSDCCARCRSRDPVPTGWTFSGRSRPGWGTTTATRTIILPR